MLYIVIFLCSALMQLSAMEVELADGFTTIEKRADGSIVRSWDNGEQWITGPNQSFGQHRHVTGPLAGTTETTDYTHKQHTILYPDGKQIRTYADGSQITEFVIDIEALQKRITHRNRLLWRAILLEYSTDITVDCLGMTIHGEKFTPHDVYYQLNKLVREYKINGLSHHDLASYFQEQATRASQPIPTDNPDNCTIGNMIQFINKESLRTFKAKALMNGAFPLVLWAVFTPRANLCKDDFRSKLHELLKQWKVTS